MGWLTKFFRGSTHNISEGREQSKPAEETRWNEPSSSTVVIEIVDRILALLSDDQAQWHLGRGRRSAPSKEAVLKCTTMEQIRWVVVTSNFSRTAATSLAVVVGSGVALLFRRSSIALAYSESADPIDKEIADKILNKKELEFNKWEVLERIHATQWTNEQTIAKTALSNILPCLDATTTNRTIEASAPFDFLPALCWKQVKLCL